MTINTVMQCCQEVRLPTAMCAVKPPCMNFPPLLPSVASSPSRSALCQISSSLLRTPYFLPPPLSLFSVSPSSEEPKPKATLRVGPRSCLCLLSKIWCHGRYIGLVRVSNLECLKAFIFAPVCFSAYSSTIGPGVKHALKDYESGLCIRICCDLSVDNLVSLWGLLRNRGKVFCVAIIILEDPSFTRRDQASASNA